MDTGGPCCMLRSRRDCFDIQTEKDVEEFKAKSQPLQALGLQNAINLTNSTHKKKQNIGRWKVWVALVLEWIEMVVSGKYSW